MLKLLIGVLAAALLIPAGWALAGGLGDDNRASAVGSTTTGARTTTTDRDDRPAKADRGRRHRGKAGTRRDGRVREAGEDVRGPCDEAEHRGDPRCTSAAAGNRHDDDHSGRRGGQDDDDRSGRGGRGSDD